MISRPCWSAMLAARHPPWALRPGLVSTHGLHTQSGLQELVFSHSSCMSQSPTGPGQGPEDEGWGCSVLLRAGKSPSSPFSPGPSPRQGSLLVEWESLTGLVVSSHFHHW